jgi:hypothetical protein
MYGYRWGKSQGTVVDRMRWELSSQSTPFLRCVLPRLLDHDPLIVVRSHPTS